MNKGNKEIIFCKISINNEDKWIHGIMTHVNHDKNIAEIFLPENYFKGYLKEGLPIIIKSLGEENEIVFYGKISRKIVSIRKQAITINIEKIDNYSNLRKFERFQVNYHTVLKTTETTYHATLSDISIGGGQIYTDSIINEESIVEVDVFVTPSITISFKGQIVHKMKSLKRGYFYGVLLNDIDQKNHILLCELIDFLSSQKQHIAHEWKVFKRMAFAIYIISILIIFAVIFYVFASTVN